MRRATYSPRLRYTTAVLKVEDYHQDHRHISKLRVCVCVCVVLYLKALWCIIPQRVVVVHQEHVLFCDASPTAAFRPPQTPHGSRLHHRADCRDHVGRETDIFLLMSRARYVEALACRMTR